MHGGEYNTRTYFHIWNHRNAVMAKSDRWSVIKKTEREEMSTKHWVRITAFVETIEHNKEINKPNNSCKF